MFKQTKPEYQTYLESEHWIKFSHDRLRAKPYCQDCKIDTRKALRLYGQRLHVHHLTYERIGNEKPEDVRVLCWACHWKRHGNGDWVEFVKNHSLSDIGEGSRQACANCGVMNGPIYFNVDDKLPEWVCQECRW